MLRMRMQDTRNNAADAQFIAAMTELVQTYAGKNATTENFKHVLEHHMMPSLNGAGNGKLDWFFEQWVYGTDIPRLTSTQGPVRLAVVPMTGNSARPLDVEIPMPKKPRAIVINALHEVLSK
jgi:hypothetical protein